MHHRQTTFKKKRIGQQRDRGQEGCTIQMMMNFYYRNHIIKIILCAIIKALIVKQSSRKLRKCKNIMYLSGDTIHVLEGTVGKIELCSCSLPESICLHEGWLDLVLVIHKDGCHVRAETCITLSLSFVQ